ncbi:MAG: ribosome-binding factor A [Microthrixaceae bacterium]
MARRRGGRPAPRPFSRTDRVGELVREVVASELERIGDERLDLVTVTGATVDPSLEHATVWYSALQAEADGRLEEVSEALEELRWPVQQVVNREVRARRTPQIEFRPDEVLTSALRVEEILRDLGEGEGKRPGDGADPVAGDRGAAPDRDG